MIEKTSASENENKSSKRKLLNDKENFVIEDSQEPRNKKGRTLTSVFPKSETNANITSSKSMECKKKPLALKTQLNNANVATPLNSETDVKVLKRKV